jgi:hypothetical protein
MKKQLCNHFNAFPGPCQECVLTVDMPRDVVQDQNLYAAEFLLYAFHFESETNQAKQKNSEVHPFMMMVTEG